MMHPDEVHIDVALVRRLLAAQFPQWSALPLERVQPMGTDNALYRLGDDMVVRLPRREQSVAPLEKELRWLPRLAQFLPLAVPLPLAAGEPGEGYPLRWAIYRWLAGETATDARIDDLAQAARDLALFVASLQRIDPAHGPTPGGHNVGRGQPLQRRDAATRAAIDALRSEIDADAVSEIWEEALHASEWSRSGVWLHGDLDARNLLVVDGKISAVLDFGTLGVGDPAAEVMVAWKVFDAQSRDIFRSSLDVDDATWTRARAWAVSQAVIALAYYTPDTNAVLVGEARRWLAEALGG